MPQSLPPLVALLGGQSAHGLCEQLTMTLAFDLRGRDLNELKSAEPVSLASVLGRFQPFDKQRLHRRLMLDPLLETLRK